jgi:D-alanyl-D-alanine carboxypeptidase
MKILTKIICGIIWTILVIMVVKDIIIFRSQDSTNKTLPYSGILQIVLDINTKIFDGQGISAAVITEKKGYWSGTSGYSYSDEPVNLEMMFNIASIGKNFLAVYIIKLAEEGKLSLDDPIAKWELGTPNIDKNITIQQLLNHTSGIFDWVAHPQSPFIIPYRDIDYSRLWTQDEILNQLIDKPYFLPGEGWHYSTTNYNLLKIIAEKVTGAPVSNEIKKRFFEPLGLKHIFYLDTDSQMQNQYEIVHNWFDVDGDGKSEDISGDSQIWILSMSPHMMYASALDLAKWSHALYSGNILSTNSLEQMLKFHRPTQGEPPVTGYGLGTEEIAIKKIIQSYGHLGFHYGSMSAMLFFPKIKTSIVVLTNENNQPLQYVASFGLLASIILTKARYFLFISILILTIVLYIGQNKRKHDSNKKLSE